MFDAVGLALKDEFGPRQVKGKSHAGGELHEGVVRALNQHVTGALHVVLLVTNEGVRRQDLGHPLSAKPTTVGVFAKGAVSARGLDVG